MNDIKTYPINFIAFSLIAFLSPIKIGSIRFNLLILLIPLRSQVAHIIPAERLGDFCANDSKLLGWASLCTSIIEFFSSILGRKFSYEIKKNGKNSSWISYLYDVRLGKFAFLGTFMDLENRNELPNSLEDIGCHLHQSRF